jgi:hypothetical protein
MVGAATMVGGTIVVVLMLTRVATIRATKPKKLYKIYDYIM